MRTPSACSGLLLALLPLLSASAGTLDNKNPSGKEVIQPPHAEPLYWGTINSGIKTNDAYTDGNFSIVAPLWSSLGADATLSGGLLFLEPYVSYGEGGEIAASLGLGYRHLFGSQPLSALTNHDGHQAGFFEEGAFIGANLFVDMLDTESDNQFWQLGVGLEAGTRYIEFRGNYYIPLSDRQLAEEQRSRETFRTSRSSSGVSGSQSVTPLGDAFATGNTVAQDGLFTNYSTRTTRTTTTTTTIERLFQRFEEGMEGWDAEVAVLVPGLDKYLDVMLIGGYYSFDNQPFGPQQGGTGNVEGWKAGVEVRPVPALVLSGTWYEDDRLTGSDWTAGVQLQLPFEFGDLGDGKGFWGRIGDAFTPRRRHLLERMAEPVGRQNAAVKLANSFKESERVVSQTSSTSVKRVTRVVSQTAQRVVLADDIIFVNNGTSVGNGIQAGTSGKAGADGTAEKPFDNVAEGAFAAGSNSNLSTDGSIWKVYTQGGTGTDYVGSVVATGSTRFISSFTPLVALGNTYFGGGTPRPVLNGSFNATSIGFLQVSGYDVRKPLLLPAAIDALNVRELLVTDNLTSGGSGIRSTTNDGGTSTVNVLRNQVTGLDTGSTYNGIDVLSQGSSTVNALVQGNDVLGGFDQGIALITAGTGVIDGTVVDNHLSGFYRLYGILVDHASGSESTAVVANNHLTGDFDQVGMAFRTSSATAGSVLDITAQGNVFSGEFDDTGITFTSGNGSRMVGRATGNQFSGTFNDIGVWGTTTGTNSHLEVEVLNNSFSGSFVSGVEFATNGTTTIEGHVEGNTFSGTFTSGVEARRSGSSTVDVDVLNNTFSGTFSDAGIYYFQNGTGTGNVYGQVQGNLLNGMFTAYGVNVEARNGIVDVDIIGNALTGNFGTGISLRRNVASGTAAKLSSDILNNTLSGDFSVAGISVDHRGTVPTDASFIGDVDIIGNVLSGGFNEAIWVSAIGGSQLNATVTNNAITAAATVDTVGIHLRSGGTSILTVSGFNNNVISGLSQTGILVERIAPNGVGGGLSVNGGLNAASSNSISNETANKLDVINGTTEPISGSFFLNNTQATLPAIVP
jgi:hypothetical protein